MPLLIDTHAHLYHKKFDADRPAMLARAFEHCSHLLLPNIDSASVAGMKQLAVDYPGRCLPMMGLHPSSVQAESLEAELQLCEDELAAGGYIAVGETGIDLYWDKSTLELQQQSLARHIAWAKQYNLPIVLHSRSAFNETMEIIEAAQDGSLRGVFHCFTDGPEQATRVAAVGFYMGIGGVLTFKNSGLAETLSQVDLKHLVLETDAPYLAPVPYRGKRNESAYVYEVAQFLAEVKGMSYEVVAEATTANAKALFRLG